jgi:hypothetical protein
VFCVGCVWGGGGGGAGRCPSEFYQGTEFLWCSVHTAGCKAWFSLSGACFLQVSIESCGSAHLYFVCNPTLSTVAVPLMDWLLIIIFNLRTAAFKAYCAIWVRRSNFRHQAAPRVSPSESTQLLKVVLWARNVREFCLNADLHVTFSYLLHAVKLRHGTDGFRIFSP